AAQPAEHVRASENPGELLGRFHPILERYDDGVAAGERLRGARRVRNLPRLDGEDDGVDHAARLVGGVHALDDEVAVYAVDAQPARAQRVEGRPARREDDVMARLRQLAAEIAAHAAHPDHGDPHGPTTSFTNAIGSAGVFAMGNDGLKPVLHWAK